MIKQRETPPLPSTKMRWDRGHEEIKRVIKHMTETGVPWPCSMWYGFYAPEYKKDDWSLNNIHHFLTCCTQTKNLYAADLWKVPAGMPPDLLMLVKDYPEILSFYTDGVLVSASLFIYVCCQDKAILDEWLPTIIGLIEYRQGGETYSGKHDDWFKTALYELNVSIVEKNIDLNTVKHIVSVPVKRA